MWRQRKLLFLLSKNKFLNTLSFNNSSSTFDPSKCELEAVPLKSRALLQISGPESRTFLQGLITNDINHLKLRPSLYTLFLNHQGRLLYDAFLYQSADLSPSAEPNTDTLFLDCDASLQPKILKHLQLFRLKKAVEIQPIERDNKSLWVIYDSGHKYVSPSNSPIELPLTDSCCAPTPPHYSSKREELPILKDSETLKQFGDARLPQLGWRVLITNKEGSGPDRFFPKQVKVTEEERGYQELRYSVGVGEGASELPYGSCFPLESNGDYLHGISFQKGCYIGQELTARTHHTGVVRKRLMPFRLPEGVTIEEGIENLQILTDKDRPVGKVRGLSRSFGIALVRVEDALNANQLILNGHLITISKPIWWPIQVSKELSSATKK